LGHNPANTAPAGAVCIGSRRRHSGIQTTAICVSIDRLCTESVVYLLIVLGLGTRHDTQGWSQPSMSARPRRPVNPRNSTISYPIYHMVLTTLQAKEQTGEPGCQPVGVVMRTDGVVCQCAERHWSLALRHDTITTRSSCDNLLFLPSNHSWDPMVHLYHERG